MVDRRLRCDIERRRRLKWLQRPRQIWLTPGASEPEIETASVPEEWPSLSVVDGRYIQEVLTHTRGNKQAAARILRIDRKTLDRMIKRHQIPAGHARFASRSGAPPEATKARA